MALLDVDHITCGYGDTQILHDVQMHADEREVITIIGPNGAGKSTLLKAVMGYLHPTAGSIRFKGKDVSTLRPDQRVLEGIAYVPQLDNVFPSLTVEENLRMGGYVLSKGEVGARMERQYESFPRLAERRKQRVRTMSGGERQMLAMARALMTEPELLMLDEPSAALSPQMADEVFDTVKRINAQGRTIVIVEQEAENSLRISHRGYVLVDGKNALEDRADSILHNEKIRDAYLGGAADAQHATEAE
ncbi:branched-chain amino acid transport system ATP-binding protein/neutral amino acid transport system ATP-binding protein [Limimonas halophila]|uniref:Branched-chain amino acid transport system ATP-binding protein/neutral amino acid transport system ATP-binding protein n=1 Tax=Limimonas halophila TaxID=1082479 RepID=A0A1G7NDQ4_9PROT|nr:ABC transporter ATP-binding protein [Limimonas halophila]SDF72235.1 branched-chain amino acid transport system ATP-binding protein/neutral amino acid transport system ATP-binding protein [Limimonas halophila]